ncbi:type I-F CRISPR-associated protein Csy2 [Glaciecola sp. KUL10]|uniref:type I-F CRISPR-associated protein Csy2 n=1 Tax=Glaciecola sp. (strain KUL10) TaxID=2161813 RepID=UPI000D7833CE|nr:type I-F CRISPR-associated protein Csy2 [Glaciecola sp. KUL10]GBL05197.1 hypothetical protein KUL10_25170 [Glaciecola sp. KUL10]
MTSILKIPRIQIQNANALSSPLTIGFPAMTSWLGFMRALELKIHAKGYDKILLNSIAVANHKFDLQVHRGVGDYVNSIIGTANPLDKDGKRPAFIEEARCHLTVTLLIELEDETEQLNDNYVAELLDDVLPRLKLAGGDILNYEKPELLDVDLEDDLEVKKLLRKCMPAYFLIERRDLMQKSMADGADALDALIENTAIHNRCVKDSDTEEVNWTSNKLNKGWIVPISTGFHAVSDLGKAKNQRDERYPHRFVESIVTLGEFVMAHRVKSLDKVLWRYSTEPIDNLYICEPVLKVESL